MPRISYDEAKAKYQMWNEAEDAIATGSSYSISDRSLTRADMATVQMMKRKYGRIVDTYESGGKRRSRTTGFYPVDR
ncbi:DUF6148 family protein [Paenibacillus sp. FSL R5-0475]|uniref:DUF6148 family protein n=1 Tax=Paenibacillus sp. FSL R5-0475 TaxID=2921643 RepID=UPI0030FA9A8F